MLVAADSDTDRIALSVLHTCPGFSFIYLSRRQQPASPYALINTPAAEKRRRRFAVRFQAGLFCFCAVSYLIDKKTIVSPRIPDSQVRDFGVARKLLFLLHLRSQVSGSNSVGRMPASQAGRRGFESRLPLHFSTTWKYPLIPRYSVYSIKQGLLARARFLLLVFETPLLRVCSRLLASVPCPRLCRLPG